MTTFRVHDRVRWARSAEMGLPDSHSLLGTVVGTWFDPDGIQRVDVTFDGDDAPIPGRAAFNYEITE